VKWSRIHVPYLHKSFPTCGARNAHKDGPNRTRLTGWLELLMGELLLLDTISASTLLKPTAASPTPSPDSIPSWHVNKLPLRPIHPSRGMRGYLLQNRYLSLPIFFSTKINRVLFSRDTCKLTFSTGQIT